MILPMFFLTTLAAVNPSGAFAQDHSYGAAGIVDGCIDSKRIGSQMKDKLKAGFCLGSINALVVLSGVLPEKYRFCPPPGTESNVTTDVVIDFIKKTRRWGEP